MNLEYNFFSDMYNKKIYCYVINDNIIKIYTIQNNKLIMIVEENIKYDMNNVEIFAIKDYFFIRIQKDDEIKNNPMECLMFSLKTKQFYDVRDSVFVNTVYMPQYLIDNNILYIVLEESYVSSNEIPEIRKIYGNIQYTNNRIIIYKFDDFIKEIKRGMNINKKIIIQSKDNGYVSLLGIKDNKIIVFNGNEKQKINYIDLNGETTEKIFDKNISFMIDNEDILFIGYNNDEIIVLDSNNKIIYSAKVNYDDEKNICGIIDNRYIVFDVNKYDSYGNSYKERQIYDCINNEEKTYNCNFIKVNDIII